MALASSWMWDPGDFDREAPYYDTAAICRRGHVLTTVAERHPPADRCKTCGAKVLTSCPNCSEHVRGHYNVPGVVDLTGGYQPPDFCHKCGAPYPWVSRQGRIYELMNLLDEEELDAADELEVREQLERLAQSDLAEDESLRRWKKVKEKAPGLWEKSGARSILESVISAGIRSGLGF